MISCKRATELVSKAQDAKLSTHEKLILRFHMNLCVFCRNFREHLKLLRKAARSGKEQLFSKKTQSESLSEEEKRNLVEKIKKRLQ